MALPTMHAAPKVLVEEFMGSTSEDSVVKSGRAG